MQHTKDLGWLDIRIGEDESYVLVDHDRLAYIVNELADPETVAISPTKKAILCLVSITGTHHCGICGMRKVNFVLSSTAHFKNHTQTVHGIRCVDVQADTNQEQGTLQVKVRRIFSISEHAGELD